MSFTHLGSYQFNSVNDQVTRTDGTIDTTGVDLIVIVATGANSPPVSDSRSNTYTGLTARNNVRIWYSRPTSVGTNTQFTVGQVGGTSYFPGGVVMLFAGSHATQPESQGAGNSVTSASSISTGSHTPGLTDCVVVAGISNTGTATQSMSGITTGASSPGVNAQAYGAAGGYSIQSSPAAVNATFTASSGTWDAHAVIAAFRSTTSTTPGAGDATASGVTMTATASLTAGSASGQTAGTASGVTLTGTASLIAGSASGSVNGTLTIPVVNNTDTPQNSITIPHVMVHRLSDRSPILSLASQATNGSGNMILVSSSLVAGTDYIATGWNADGSEAFIYKGTAT